MAFSARKPSLARTSPCSHGREVIETGSEKLSPSSREVVVTICDADVTQPVTMSPSAV
jgi:hypothetical protein